MDIVDIWDIYQLLMTNTSPWKILTLRPCFFDGPNRNRWFLPFLNMGGSFQISHVAVSHNQLVCGSANDHPTDRPTR